MSDHKEQNSTSNSREKQETLNSNVDAASAPQIMSTPPTPTTARHRRRRSHDTGFPEPFGENYNTTLPHPDADLSPNPVMTFDSLPVGEHIKRRKHTLLNKHRHSMIHRSSSTTSQGIYGVLPLVASAMPGSSGSEDHPPSPAPSGAQEGNGSLESNRSIGDHDADVARETIEEKEHEQGSKKGSFMGLLRRRSRD